MIKQYLPVRPVHQNLPFGIKLFINLAMLYMLLLSVLYFFNVEAIKQLANLFAIMVFVVIFIYVVFMVRVPKIPVSLTYSLIIYYLAMLVCFVTNGLSQDFAVYIKMLISPAFVIFGYAMGKPPYIMNYVRRNIYFSIIMFVGIPSVTMIINILGGTYDGYALGIFANRNNAALYMISLLALMNCFHLKMRDSVAFALMVGVIFATLGVLIAVLLALLIVFFSLNNIRFVLLAFLLLVMAYFFSENIAVFSRLQTAYDSLLVLYNAGSGALDQMTYAELYSLTGSTDLSLFFRLKHWNDILTLWGNSPTATQLFGCGVGGSEKNTLSGLVPHNDYLRYFYECGVFAFFGFIFLQFSILKGIGRNHFLVPFLVISIYFISENLVNNYLAMIIYYFSSGMILRQLGRGYNKVQKIIPVNILNRSSFSRFMSS